MVLRKDNLKIFSAKNYLNEKCLSEEEFLEDYAKFGLVKKLVKKLANDKKVNIRLLCNHMLLVTNTFDMQAVKSILHFGATDAEISVTKTVMNYFGFIGYLELPNVKFDLNTAKLLKEMDR